MMFGMMLLIFIDRDLLSLGVGSVGSLFPMMPPAMQWLLTRQALA